MSNKQANPRHKRRLSDETRSRRVQILVQPTLYHDIKAKAEVEGMSVNDVIHHLLELVRTSETP